ncbi:MAG: polysaccharide deacetylase family protein [Candidatus Firestonebacteria bacterium]|nr:polysaccharide deacetylase family protein [Candidatus Firestonebacteria bacterium]
MSWFFYTTLWALSLAGTTWVLADNLPTRLVFLLALLCLYLITLALGSAYPRMNFYFASVCRGPADQGWVSLTFDDGPDPKVTPELLQILKDEGVKAAFFMVGRAAEAHPALVKRVEADGHLIGNHMFDHQAGWPFRPAFAIRQELARANELLAKLIGNRPRFVRMPFSISRPGLVRTFRKLNLTPVGWDVRGLEGVYREPARIAEHVANEARNGSVILLHECYYRTLDFGPERVVETVRLVIARLRERGFVFKRLDEMLELEGYIHEA